MRCSAVLRSLVGAAGLGVAAWACAEDFKVTLVPVFQGLSASVDVFPVMVVVSNKGPNANGVLMIQCGSYAMNYPVELPQGTTKQVATFPSQVGYSGELTVRLATNQGSLAKAFSDSSWYQGTGMAVAMITDNPGLMAFLPNRTEGQNAATIGDCYTTPEMAPDRPVGYTSIQSIVLGEGSERLNDAQVRALKVWLMAGGHLVFVGGASSPACEDPRWADVIPVTGSKPIQAPGTAVTSLGGSALTESFPMLAGKLTQGAFVPSRGSSRDSKIYFADQKVGQRAKRLTPPLMVTKRIGLGETTFMAFNLFEAPFTKWNARRSTLIYAAQPTSRAASFYVNSYLATEMAHDYTYYGGAPTMVSGTTSTGSTTGGSSSYSPPRPLSKAQAAPSGDGPFTAKLPNAENVFWVLAAFFIAVVPVNFIVLRRVKKGEWAWLTAPVLSVGFAAYFLSSASALYSAKLSQATGGLLIGAEGMSQAYFIGQSEMFFPRGGNYNLGFKGVDQISEIDRDDYYGMSSQRRSNFLQELAATDLGEVRAPKLNVGNLSFREFTFHQVIPAGKWFKLTGAFSKDKHKLSFKGSLTNTSPYTLYSASLVAVPFAVDLKAEIRPGETVEVKGSSPLEVVSSRKPDQNSLRGLRLEAIIGGLKPGPQIGEVVSGRSSTYLAYSFNLPLPEELL